MTAKQRCGVAHQVVLYETGARGYGLREDSESNNSQYKQKMHHGRARTVGANNLRLDLLAYQCVTIITTLVAPHRIQFQRLVRGLSATIPGRPHRLSRNTATRTLNSRGRITVKQSRTRPRALKDPLQ